MTGSCENGLPSILTCEIQPQNGSSNERKLFDTFSPRIAHDQVKRRSIMKEFKFACPHCNQHIQVAENLAGRQFQCPN
jgi:hypothetical protein